MKTKSFARGTSFAVLFIAILIAGCKKEPQTDPGNTPAGAFFGGLLRDESSENIPQNISLVGSSNLPSRVDLTPFLPPVGNQGAYGTCVAWSTGYYIRTAMQAIRHNLSANQLKDPAKQFSPKDLFLSVPPEYKGQNCDGSVYARVMQQLVDRGVATLSTVPYNNLGDCSDVPAPTWTNEANQYRIDSYRAVPAEVEAMKAELAKDRPIMLVTRITKPFQEWKGANIITAADVLYAPVIFEHALTAIGYDDAKQAFRVVNSWGTQWADNGFAWIDYDLATNPNFCPGGAVLIDKPAEVNDPSTPPPGSSNLAATLLRDVDDPTNSDNTFRQIEFNVANNSNQSIPAATDWNIYYLYYDAFDANRYGILLDMYVSNDYGNYGESGYNPNGAGSWYSQWTNIDMPANSNLSEQMFGPGNTYIYWPYQMPRVNGYYYLVMIVDPYNSTDEFNESDNFYFMTGKNGGPIWFQDGVIQGLHSGGAEDRGQADICRTPVNPEHSNAYRPEEIKEFIKKLKAEGKLPRHGKNINGQAATPGK